MNNKTDFNNKNYLSFGKKYNNEKAIISLTSWTARINTVAKTIYSLIKECPGFHIVLVLSEEEFPNLINELPDNLKLFIDMDLIEVMFIYKNYKSFKKVLFTMNKYNNIPIISADDDCIYTCNYAQDLYTAWKNTNECIKYTDSLYEFMSQGPATIYSPKYYTILIEEFKKYKISNYRDDGFIENVFKKLNIPIKSLNNKYFPFNFHDEFCPINGGSINYPPHWYKQSKFKK